MALCVILPTTHPVLRCLDMPHDDIYFPRNIPHMLVNLGDTVFLNDGEGHVVP